MKNLIAIAWVSIFINTLHAQSSDFFTKFDQVKKQNFLYIGKGNDTLENILKFTSPINGSFINGKVSLHPFKKVLDAYPLMVVFLKEKEFKELKKVNFDSSSSEIIPMFYQSESIFINGTKSNVIYASVETFMINGVKSNALFLLQQLCKYLQDLRSDTISNLDREEEAYLLTSYFFKASLSQSEKTNWNSLIQGAQLEKNPEQLVNNLFYIESCERQFGDKGLIYFLIVEVITPNIYFFQDFGK